jgi:hypothetical protein
MPLQSPSPRKDWAGLGKKDVASHAAKGALLWHGGARQKRDY